MPEKPEEIKSNETKGGTPSQHPYQPPNEKEVTKHLKSPPENRIRELIDEIKNLKSVSTEVGDKVPDEKEIRNRLANINGEVFLRFSPEDLRVLFLEEPENIINFHGNRSAFRAIGMGDLLEVEKYPYVKINGRIGRLAKSSVFGQPKIGYIDTDGVYMGIDTGYKIDLKVSDAEIADYETQTKQKPTLRQNFIDFGSDRKENDKTKAEIREIRNRFRRQFREIDEGFQPDTFEAIDYTGPIPQSHMRKAVELIARFEGFREKAYWDRTGYAVGYGMHRIKNENGQWIKVSENTRLTKTQAQALLPEVISEHVRVLVKRIDPRKLTPNQFASLASLAYNYGPNFFAQKRGGRILRALEKGDLKNAYNAIASLWENKIRRLEEARMMLG